MCPNRATVAAGSPRRQHGVVTRRQLVEEGVAAKTVTRMAAAGSSSGCTAGVYAVGHRAIGEKGRALAASWRAGRVRCWPAVGGGAVGIVPVAARGRRGDRQVGKDAEGDQGPAGRLGARRRHAPLRHPGDDRGARRSPTSASRRSSSPRRRCGGWSEPGRGRSPASELERRFLGRAAMRTACRGRSSTSASRGSRSTRCGRAAARGGARRLGVPPHARRVRARPRAGRASQAAGWRTMRVTARGEAAERLRQALARGPA